MKTEGEIKYIGRIAVLPDGEIALVKPGDPDEDAVPTGGYLGGRLLEDHLAGRPLLVPVIGASGKVIEHEE